MTYDPHFNLPPRSAPQIGVPHGGSQVRRRPSRLVGARILMLVDSDLSGGTAEVLRSVGADVTERHWSEQLSSLRAGPGAVYDAALLHLHSPQLAALSLVDCLRRSNSPCATAVLLGGGAEINIPIAIRCGAEVIVSEDLQTAGLEQAMQQALDKTRQWRRWLRGVRAEQTYPELASIPAPTVPEPPRAATDVDGVVRTLADSAKLSGREAQVLRAVLLGASNPKIAAQLKITVRTVKFHVRNLMSKLGADSRGEMMRIYFQHLNARHDPG